jgi:flagellar hook-associated protein FlgK
VSSIFADTSKAAPNGYTLTQVTDPTTGKPTNQITLTPNPVNGVQGQSQTVSIPNGVLGASQSIDFSQYGIALNVSNPANYISTGVIGLNTGQQIGNQTITSVVASTAGLAMGGYQIVAGSAAGKVKLSGPGGYLSSDVTVLAGTTGGQLLDFGNGVKIEFADNGAGDSASTIAANLAGTSFTVGIHAGSTLASSESISSINASSGAQPGAYQFSSDGNGNLTLTANINGNPISQTIALTNIQPGGSQSINFSNLGISLTVGSAAGVNAQTLANDIVGTNPINQLVIAPGIDTGLDLASGLSNQTFNVTSSTNSALTYGLAAENFVSLAPSDPSRYMNGTTPYISSAAANAVASMNPVFGNAVANLVSDVGTKVATWTNNQKADSAVLTNLQSQNSSVSGVNLDEEAANLLKYQQLYAASSKVLQAGNQMFSSLLAIMN